MTRKKKKKQNRRSEDEVSDQEIGISNSGEINLNKLTFEEAYIYKMSTPISCTNLMVNHPLCLVLVIFFLLIIISLATISFGWMLPNDPHNRDFFVWGSEEVN